MKKKKKIKQKTSPSVKVAPGKAKKAHAALPRTGITPLGDRVLVRPFTEAEAKGEKKDFGIILPESISKEKSAQGEVIAVGPGRYESGKLTPVNVKVGDKIMFSKYSYDEIEHKGEEYYLLKEDNILAVIK